MTPPVAPSVLCIADSPQAAATVAAGFDGAARDVSAYVLGQHSIPWSGPPQPCVIAGSGEAEVGAPLWAQAGVWRVVDRALAGGVPVLALGIAALSFATGRDVTGRDAAASSDSAHGGASDDPDTGFAAHWPALVTAVDSAATFGTSGTSATPSPTALTDFLRDVVWRPTHGWGITDWPWPDSGSAAMIPPRVTWAESPDAAQRVVVMCENGPLTALTAEPVSCTWRDIVRAWWQDMAR